jgi:hypothetical protein
MLTALVGASEVIGRCRESEMALAIFGFGNMKVLFEI